MSDTPAISDKFNLVESVSSFDYVVVFDDPEVKKYFHNIVLPAAEELTEDLVRVEEIARIVENTAKNCAGYPKMVRQTIVAETSNVVGVDYQKLKKMVEDRK